MIARHAQHIIAAAVIAVVPAVLGTPWIVAACAAGAAYFALRRP